VIPTISMNATMRQQGEEHMRVMNWRVGAVVASLLLGTVAGCAAGPAAQSADAERDTQAAATEPNGSEAGDGTAAGEGSFPVTIDNCGREITFHAPPERVLTGYQNTVELMIALGLEDRVVGRQPFEQSPLLPEQEDAFAAIPELAPGLPDDAQSVAASREVQLAANPDFVLASGEFEVDASRGVASIEDFEAAGAQVYIMESGGSSGTCEQTDQASIDLVYTDILNIGRIFGVQDTAEALVEDMRAEIAEVQERVEGQEPVRVFAYDSGEGPLYAISDRYFDVSLAGADNVIDDPQQGFPEVGQEVVAAADPEVIVTSNYEPGPLEEEAAAKEAYLRQALPNSAAVADGRFVHIENIELTPGVRNARAVRQLAEAFHPEAFE